MAERLDTFPNAQRYRRYPWDEWEHGIWQVTQGEDFDCGIGAFTSGLYLHAANIGRKVRTTRMDTDATVVFEFYDKSVDPRAQGLNA